jgi:NAD(P)-dependent dehydrogenase (short-subunit alcohol dehydrogenase family)
MGLAIAKEFAERNGATVMTCPRSDGRAKRVAILLNGKSDSVNIDVTSDASIVSP